MSTTSSTPTGSGAPTAYPHLLSPLDVPGGRLRNRVVMGSMHTGLEDRPWLREELSAYYAERAAGGVGLIVTGGYAPTLRGRLTPLGAQFSDPVTARRHQVVTDAVHEHGAQIALQLLHAFLCLGPWAVDQANACDLG